MRAKFIKYQAPPVVIVSFLLEMCNASWHGISLITVRDIQHKHVHNERRDSKGLREEIEKLCCIPERALQRNKENYLRLRPFPDEQPSSTFTTNLIKINHLPQSPHFTFESSPIPSPDYSSACGEVPRLHVSIFRALLVIASLAQSCSQPCPLSCGWL